MLRTLVPRSAGKQAVSYAVPKHIRIPSYAAVAAGGRQEDEFAAAQPIDERAMRATCQLAARVLDDVCEHVQSLFATTAATTTAATASTTTAQSARVTTAQIDQFAARRIFELGAYPSCLGFHGFPRAICLSVNETVAHGVPNATVLRRGDVLNVDVTVFKDGCHGDTARAIVVGERSDAPSDDASLAALFDASRRAVAAGIGAARAGAYWTAIPAAIDAALATCGRQFRVCNELGAHGIGQQFHQLPVVPMTMRGLHSSLLKRNTSPTIQVGDIFTVEPVVCVGRGSLQLNPLDGWSLSLERGARGVMFEHTILVTNDGPEILTTAT